MKMKIYDLFKRYKLAFLIALGIVIIGMIGIIVFLSIGNHSQIKEFKNDTYSVKYDNSWKIDSKEEKSILLKHNKGSTIHIEVIELQDEYQYSTIEDILDELLYDIEKQNKVYKLLSKKKDSITKNSYDGYKMLYENGNRQSMVIIGKKSDKLMIFTYEADNDYFDILLDSVHNIVYDFDIVEQTFNLSQNLNIKTQKIGYTKSDAVKDLLGKLAHYEIASNNYHVTYSLPSGFTSSILDSTSGFFSLQGLKDGSITMSVSIYNKNIYEHLDKEAVTSVYSEWELYKTDKDYSKFTESIDKLDSEYESYIYKNSYYYDKTLSYDKDFNIKYTSQLRENVVLMYALDKNHLLLIKISALKVGIPKELIDMIKVDSAENYSSFITSIKKDGYIFSNLKREKDLSLGTIEEIKLKIPEKYREIDKGTNVYQEQYYSLNYNENLDIYDYEIKYSLTSINSKVEDKTDSINHSFSTTYGNYQYLTYSGEKEFNGKKFQVYDGGYTQLSGIMFTSINRIEYYVNVKVLFYELPTGGFLILRIDGNNVQIGDEILNDLTNFEI